jgi:hypothetical protein
MLGKRVRSQVATDRLPAKADLIADGDLGETLLMQREHGLVPSQALRTARLLLFLGMRLAGWCGRRCEPGRCLGWSSLGQREINSGCGPMQRGALACEDTLEQLTDVRQEMKAIGNLDRSRCALTCAVGIRTRTIAADDLNVRMLAQPRRKT